MSKYASSLLVGKLDSYTGGGYVVELNGRAGEVKDKLAKLRDSDWLDTHTRAVILEFATYNAQVMQLHTFKP
jgi:hypothetical protein